MPDTRTSLDDRTTTALLRAAERWHHRYGGVPVAVLFAQHRQLDDVVRWLVAAARHDRADAVICALDDELHAFLVEHGIPSVRVPWDGTVAGLRAVRMQVLLALVDRGISFIHTDPDAVWVGDPLPHVAPLGHTDLVASQGTTRPADALEVMGAVVSCGFFAVRASTGTADLLREVQDRVHRDPLGDEQAALNRVLAGRGAVWAFVVPAHVVAVGDLCVATYDRVVRGTTRAGLSLALLPHTLFQQVDVGGSPVVVNHAADATSGTRPAAPLAVA